MNDPNVTAAFELGPNAPAQASLPERIGRYRVLRILGRGGYGIVYLADDEQLQRPVAVKVPHRHLIAGAGGAELYLAEARMVARLDHPHIVPVHDVGSTDQFPCFIVSKYIDGKDLATRLRESRLSFHTAADLTASIADALHHAHKLGLVHRDIKPGNILLDRSEQAYLADFGVALREQDVGKGPRYAGTLAYMSPEQARGEGHRVDGRSDIFSLGVVLYRLLTGRRPFGGTTDEEQLEQIINVEARPPRQIDDQIPRELERICLKALAKRASERYTTAKDMADDLRHLLQSSEAEKLARWAEMAQAGIAPAVATTPAPAPMPTPSTAPLPARIVPRGLRSFDAQDADFFLELLSGPRDRDGLPDSIRFWKSRIEETDPDNTFLVGLMYGPSGCGKSSLVKAGLLPRLSADLIAVYIEATAEETETRLQNGLRKRCPGLSPSLGLKETLASLRRGQGLAAGKKVLIVLDQFEQWLHARKEAANTELVHALRHCDGVHVQCVVMVRDDFWLAVSRFMRDLEVDLVPGRNIALVDLFDLDHARKVLAAFGRAFGKLPSSDVTKEQKGFLNQAVSGLSQDNKVVCVRLALFAEMMKGRSWMPATLKEVGGTEGIGVTFLEDTFMSATANPKHRLHSKAAQAVLRTLLPEAGSDIKGNMRSEADLRAASGYAARPRDFDELIRVLDGELRLLTPTDPEGAERGDRTEPAQRYYQLTHDYLVHSLKEWLTRKQKETRQGRAELRLAERSALWTGKPLNRHLPSLSEWLRIWLFTRSRTWTPPQRKMMRRSDAYYLLRGLVLLTFFGLVAWGAWEYTERLQAHSLRDHLLSADMAEVPAILADIEARHGRVEPLLRESFASENDARKKLLLGLALVRSDRDQVKYLYEELLQAAPRDFAVIRQVLAPYKEDISDDLWKEFAAREPNSERRFRAACALVEYAREDPRWAEAAAVVVDGLVPETPLALIHWQNALAPVKVPLLAALAASMEENKWSATERRAIIEFYGVFSDGDSAALQPLRDRLARQHPGTGAEQARRKATTLAALAALGKPDEAWPYLVHTPDPTLRSYLIERLGSSGLDPEILKNRLDTETDTSRRRALVLALGAFPSDRFPELGPFLVGLYTNDPDAGIHGAASWMLRKWKQEERLDKIDKKLATGRVEAGRNWYVTRQHQTMSILPAPRVLVFAQEEKTQATGKPHIFAIGATEVTVEQFRAFKNNHKVDETIATTADSPVHRVSWYEAAEYCNWLSECDAIPATEWCYQRKNGQLEMVPDYLKRSGYRLPTEAEWEFACRAGAATPWCFGEGDEELLGHYARWFGNSHVKGGRQTFPVGSVKPNDWGVFDMHGNVAEWCQESAQPQTGNFEDIECAYRGGSYLSPYGKVDSRASLVYPRIRTSGAIGFRVARTVVGETKEERYRK